MSKIFCPPGLELYVNNPGYGEIIVTAPTAPFEGGKALVDEEWRRELYGPKIGQFLTWVTGRALGVEPDRSDLPTFITDQVARTLLPDLQKAALLALGGTDRYDRTFPDDDDQHPPLCAVCNLGTYFTPGAMPSPWCEQYGHRPFGTPTRRWDDAQRSHARAVTRAIEAGNGC